MKRKSKFGRNIIFTAALAAFFIVGVVVVINHPYTIRCVLKAANAGSRWKIGLDKFVFKPLSNKIVISGLNLKHAKSGKEIEVENISAAYNPLGFLKGKFVVSRLEIEGVRALLPKTEAPDEKKHIDITKLFFLQNIAVDDGIVNNIAMSFHDNVSITIDRFGFSVKPSFFGDTTLRMNAEGVLVSRNGESLAGIGAVGVKTATKLAKWGNVFPYLNALSGEVNLKEGHLEAMSVDSLYGKLNFIDHKLKADSITAVISGQAVSGHFNANTQDQTFDGELDIPKPISLPYIVRPLSTIDTAGDFSGHVKLEGKGFIPSKSGGHGEVSFSHRFNVSPEIPIEVAAKWNWEKGLMKFDDAYVAAGSDKILIDGSIDLVRKNIMFAASGANFPIERVFDKFRLPQYRLIFGPSDFKGSFEGWGKAFHIKASGTTHSGGYGPIVLDTVNSEVDFIYDKLSLKFDVVQEGELKGGADVEVKYGKKTEGQNRPKDLNLHARLDRYNLKNSFAFAGLSGLGSGELAIKGPPENFIGEAKGEISQGSWFFVPFDSVSADIDLARKKIVFKNIRALLQKLDPINPANPITMDLFDGWMKIKGEPDPKFAIDVDYKYAPKQWIIHKLTYKNDADPIANLEVKGSLASKKSIDLSARGNMNVKILTPLGFVVREAAGPLYMDISAKGNIADPELYGVIEFKECSFAPRGFGISLERLRGKLLFDGHSLTFDDIYGLTDSGSFKTSGKIVRRGFEPSSADLMLNGKDLHYRSPDGSFKMEFNGDLKMKGDFPHPLISGEIAILDGSYSKNFNLIESITKASDKRNIKNTAISNFLPKLDLHIYNAGDLFIHNNVGDIGLHADFQVRGAQTSPEIIGAVEATEGKIHYMGLEFDITQGFLEYRNDIPYLELTAQREITIYNITVNVHGPVDNLAMDLSAMSPSGALEKRDIISLIAFGMTETERQSLAVAQGGGQFGATIAAQQLSQVIERPVSKIAHLDTFRLEAADPTLQSISRISIGKRLSDRLSVDFATDINTKDATQTLAADYLLTDNLLLKASRSSDGRYKIDGTIRFRLR